MPMRGIFCCARAASGHASRAAEQRDELAALNHSITSSARASSVGATDTPWDRAAPAGDLPGDIILALPNDGNARFSIPSRAWR